MRNENVVVSFSGGKMEEQEPGGTRIASMVEGINESRRLERKEEKIWRKKGLANLQFPVYVPGLVAVTRAVVSFSLRFYWLATTIIARE